MAWPLGRRLGALAMVAVLPVAPLSANDALLRARPCGPDSVRGPLRLVIPQGAFGGDFRPACRAHDACYDTPGSDRTSCDDRFLADMLGACADARFPALCRRAARAMHRSTARHGEESFRSAQMIALRKLAAE